MGLLFELKEGASLPELNKTITQPDINLYAEASRDFNPIHIDEEFAKNTPLGGTIAHGMLVLAYVSQMLTDAIGIKWLTGGKLDARFKTPARPGDTLTISGRVTKVQEAGSETLLSIDINCRNQKDEVIISGEAFVKLGNDDSGG